jgi:hypothetical protein
MSPQDFRGRENAEMNSHEALIDYASPMDKDAERLRIDLFAAVPVTYGETHRAMVEHFQMVESGELHGLVTLRAKCNQAQFLAFFGQSWNEALKRWPTLAFFHEYREQHGEDNYLSVAAWKKFYQLVNDGVEATTIDVVFIEHG